MNGTTTPTIETNETEIRINWKDLWDKSKLEFWSLLAFVIFSFAAALLRLVRKRRDGGREELHAGGGPSFSAATARHGTDQEDGRAGEGTQSDGGGEGNGGSSEIGGGDASETGDGRLASSFRPTAGRKSWRW